MLLSGNGILLENNMALLRSVPDTLSGTNQEQIRNTERMHVTN